MTNANLQIIEAYEVASLSPEEIAEQFEWEVEAVKTILMQGSKKFFDLVKKQDLAPVNPAPEGGEPEQLFDTYEMQTARNAIASLVVSTEDDHIKLMAAKFIINENKGRHDVKAMQKNNFSITIINERMKQAKAAQQRTIDVASKILKEPPGRESRVEINSISNLVPA